LIVLCTLHSLVKMRASLTCAIVALLGAAPSGARAAGPSAPGESPRALVGRGIALYREAGYAASVAMLERARATRALEATELAECAYYLAADYVALGSLEAARRELRELLSARPMFELPAFTSPKVATLFAEVQAEREQAPRLRAMPPRQHTPAKPTELELWFEPARMGGVAYGSSWWRWRGARDWREAPLGHAGENLVARVELARAGTLEYWAEARGPSGIAQAGSAAHPLEVPVASAAPAEQGRAPLWRRWWLWTAVGAATAGLGVGLGLYLGLRR
jgi:hypothetical protein